jgi:hypothetical protein
MGLQFNPEGSTNRGTTSDPQRHSRDNGRAAVTALERRLSELEELATSQDRELRIRFERIVQLQAECDSYESIRRV